MFHTSLEKMGWLEKRDYLKFEGAFCKSETEKFLEYDQMDFQKEYLRRTVLLKRLLFKILWKHLRR